MLYHSLFITIFFRLGKLFIWGSPHGLQGRSKHITPNGANFISDHMASQAKQRSSSLTEVQIYHVKFITNITVITTMGLFVNDEKLFVKHAYTKFDIPLPAFIVTEIDKMQVFTKSIKILYIKKLIMLRSIVCVPIIDLATNILRWIWVSQCQHLWLEFEQITTYDMRNYYGIACVCTYTRKLRRRVTIQPKINQHTFLSGINYIK